MWLLDSISRVPFQKPYLILTCVLGAVFQLLAHFLSLSALHEPLTYSLLGPTLLLGFQNHVRLRSAALLTGICTALAFFLFPVYRFLFALSFSFLIGKWVFPELFRAWKWLVCSALLLLSIEILFVWQQINFNPLGIPELLMPLVHSTLFSFCIYCSFLLYAVRKDSVLEAFDHYSWNPSTDAAGLARETLKLYQNVGTHLPAREDLESYTEKMIHLCHQLQEVTERLNASNLAMLQVQMAQLRESLDRIADPVAKIQYEQAVLNKERQLRQIDVLQNRQDRLRGQVLNYNSALETMQFTYANRSLNSAAIASETIDLFMDVAKVRAEAEL